MRRNSSALLSSLLVLVMTAGLAGPRIPPAAAAETLDALSRRTHFHGIAVDRADPARLYLATHHGLYVVDGEGRVSRRSERTDDFMGFTPHPSDPSVLFASGHPPGGGNLGVILSRDGGRSWQRLSDGARGPVDFHQMDVSRADPNVIYGVYRGLQKSTDGGRTWTLIAPAPEGLIDLAAGSRPGVLFAATQRGVLRSTDDGRSWQPAHPGRSPATMVHIGENGRLYAFIVGVGLVRAEEDGLNWEVRNDRFGNQAVLHLADTPAQPDRLYAVSLDPATHAQSLLASEDGGANWSPFPATAREQR